VAAPTEPSRGDFAGWVPTTSGHLSFSVVGRRLRPSACCFNNLETAGRADVLGVAVAQKRVNRDAAAPLRWLGRRFGPVVRRRWPQSKLRDWLPEGHVYYFFLLAEPRPALTPYFDKAGKLQHRPDARGALKGSVFFLAEGKTLADRRRRSAAARRLSDMVHAYNLNPPILGQDWLACLRSEFRSEAGAAVDFTLYRTGELRMNAPLTPYKPGAEDPSEQRLSLARHIYYFIKDCAHQHHHHRPQDDQLLPLIPVDDPGLKADGHWRRQILWALTKAVGQFRRDKEHVKRRQALGVIAYAEAFQVTLARIRRPAGKKRHVVDDSLATFTFTQQRASIEVSKEVDSWRRQGVFSTMALAVASIISFSSLWFAVARTARPEWGGPTTYHLGIGTFVQLDINLQKWFFVHYDLFLIAVLAIIAIGYDRTYAFKSRTESLLRLAFAWLASRHRRARVLKVLATMLYLGLVGLILGFAVGFWSFGLK
jgi:hypothetical protein